MSIDISAVTRRIQYSGSAGTGPYQFAFEILAQTDVAVYVDETLQTLTTDYTVTINGDGTGSITLVVAATGANTITIIGDRAIARSTDFVTGGDLLADSLNDELDSLTIYCQQLEEKFDRCFAAPEYDTATSLSMPDVATRASKYLAFDADGNPVATSGTTSTIVVSTFAETVLDDANAAAARATLGAVGLTGNETVAGNKTLSGDTVHTGKVTMTSKSIVEAEGAAVASAASCNIWAGDGNTVHITGTTQIDDFATAPQAGAWMRVIFDDALILNQSANLNLNGGGADITTAAGDMAFVYADTTTQMDVFVVRKSGREVAPPTPAISVSYDSGDQTITAGGALTLAHSLGASPKFIQCLLKCNDGGGDVGYANGDYVFINTTGYDGGTSASSTGVSIVPDSTNLNVRFGSAAEVFIINNKGTGALQAITASKWKFIVRAYA